MRKKESKHETWLLRILVSNDDGVYSPGIAAPLRLDLTDEKQLAAMQSRHPLPEPE